MAELMHEFFVLYYKDVYGYLYGLCRDSLLAEDLASETFLEAVKSVSRFRGEADAKTWLFSIARNRWYAYLRKKKRQVQTVEPDETLLGGDNPAEQAENAETAEAIRDLLSHETERTQDIVRMRIEGYSYYEIAKKHGISESSARVIDFRARTKIRKELGKR